MKDIFNDTRLEFTASYIADLSKAIFAVALASNFFIELPPWLRIFLPVVGITFFLIAFFIKPPGGKK